MKTVSFVAYPNMLFTTVLVGGTTKPGEEDLIKKKRFAPPVPPDVSEHLRFAFAHSLTMGKAAKIDIQQFSSFCLFISGQYLNSYVNTAPIT